MQKKSGLILLVAVLTAFMALCISLAPGRDAGIFGLGQPALADTEGAGKAGNSKEEAVPQPVKASLLSDSAGIVPGGKFKLAVRFAIDPGWHTYYKEPGDSGMPPNFTWILPKGFSAGPILWQKPHKTVEAELIAYGYQGEVLHVSEITAPADLKIGDKVTLKVKVKYLVCKEICLPGKADLEITLPVVAAPAAKSSDAAAIEAIGGGFNDPVSTLSAGEAGNGHTGNASGPAAVGTGNSAPNGAQSGGQFSILDQKFGTAGGTDENLLDYLLPAFIGGLILNIMPCVLPVIAIKVLSLLEQAKEEPAKVKLLGLVFSAGIITSFMCLAAIVIAIKAAGQSVGWGFQFQYPGFVLVMSAVILLMALSLFGMFYVDVQAAGSIDKLARKDDLTGAFFKGVMATVLSTPCSAPFLGTAIGFAFAHPPHVIALIFFTVAIGMASPYLLLTINPKWMRFLPKPGDWMEKFKQAMGFILLATVVWLDSVLASEIDHNAFYWVNTWLVGLAFSAWIIASFSDLTSSQARRAKVLLAAAASLGLFTYVCVFAQPGVLLELIPEMKPPQSDKEKAEAASETASQALKGASEYGITWEPFTVERLNENLNQKKTVLLDFTADWCLTCKVNEKTVLATKEVSEKLKALKVVTMKADWTRQDPDITRLLNKFNRSGVPLYVIFPGNRPAEPIVLPEVIDQKLVIDKLDQAAK